MSVAGFVLGLVATVLAVASLGWQIGTFLRQRPRPRLTAVIGRLTPDGLLTNDASADVRECLSNAAEQFDDLVIGVKVVNAGRRRSTSTGGRYVPIRTVRRWSRSASRSRAPMFRTRYRPPAARCSSPSWRMHTTSATSPRVSRISVWY